MSFPIQFYLNKDPKNKINKTHSTPVYTVNGTLRDESNIVDPEILVESNVAISANYAHIALFDRWYFVKEWKVYRSGLWICRLHCDVLKSHATGILGSTCIVSRSQNRFNLYLNDTRYKRETDEMTITRSFPNGFDVENAVYVLALLGKEATPSS